MNKKAIFFTIMAIALLSLFLVSYSVYSFAQNREGIDKRIKTMNNYISSLEEDVPRSLYISGYRILFLFNNKIIESGEYIPDVDGSFREAFFEGSIDGIDYRTGGTGQFGNLLYDSTYQDIVEDINEKAKSLNINVSFDNPEIEITQNDPWHVKVSLKSDLLIQDKGKLAKWEKDSVLFTYIPIANFEDPLHIKNTNAMVANKFEQTPYALPILGNDLLNHAKNSYYIARDTAPSFLNRLEGDLTEDENGIESLVNTHNLSSIQDVLLLHGITVQDKCIIDYIYFNPDSDPAITATYGDNGWIKLCGENPGTYGVVA